MVQEEFSDEETRIVREILEGYISGLASEVYGSDNFSFGKTQELMHKRDVIKEVIERMEKKVA